MLRSNLLSNTIKTNAVLLTKDLIKACSVLILKANYIQKWILRVGCQST